ncbi:MAG TPA: hypothetical protein PKH77_00290 [Anaerolineae bacterium]|nr:hypothetical protein [Anaerolineae bacterium]
MLTTYEGVVREGRVQLVIETPLPEGTPVLVTVLPHIDERRARRKANHWLADYVGDMVMADHPHLTHNGQCSVWRFGAYVTSLQCDPFGPVGYVEVNAETGVVLADDQTAEEIARRGEHLERAPLSAGN